MLDHSCQAQRHSHAERGHDLYETPSVAVEALLRVLALPRGAIWEPACGRSAIANVLRAYGHRVVCTDLIDYGTDPNAIYGVDFLKTTELPDGVGCILTDGKENVATMAWHSAGCSGSAVTELIRCCGGFPGRMNATARPRWES